MEGPEGLPANTGGEKMTWKDLANFEDPFDTLEVDPARYDPDTLGRRLLRITNTLIDLFRVQGENQKKITDMGGKKKETAAEYQPLRSEQIIIESKIEALKFKYNTLRSINARKNTEFGHTE